jgi:hypothetical protein
VTLLQAAQEAGRLGELQDAALVFLTLGPGLITVLAALLGWLHVWGPFRRPGIEFRDLAAEGIAVGTIVGLLPGALLGVGGAIVTVLVK